MQRVTVTLDDDLLGEIDELIAARGYQNRSEAIRDLARAGVRASLIDSGRSKYCVAALVYVYDHGSRELGKRLTQIFHDHHDVALSTLHVHLDHESCMEVAVLRGRTATVTHLAEHVIAERNIRHGQLVLVPVEQVVETHAHGTAAAHRHEHHVIHRRARR